MSFISEVIFYRVCMQEYFWHVLCWKACPLLECHLSEVSLYIDLSCLAELKKSLVYAPLEL